LTSQVLVGGLQPFCRDRTPRGHVGSTAARPPCRANGCGGGGGRGASGGACGGCGGGGRGGSAVVLAGGSTGGPRGAGGWCLGLEDLEGNANHNLDNLGSKGYHDEGMSEGFPQEQI